MSTAFDFAQAQHLALRASRRTGVHHRVISFCSPEGGREFIKQLQQPLRSGVALRFGTERSDAQAVDLALGLTHQGLEALAVPDGYLSLFRRLAPAFAAGAAPRAAQRLGDTGDSAATHWDPAFDHRCAHALVTLHGEPEARAGEGASALDMAVAALNKLVASTRGVAFLGEPMVGKHLPTPKERQAVDGAHWTHFGYRDGLSGPRLRRSQGPQQRPPPHAAPQSPQPPSRWPTEHEPGELLLGEVRDLGDNPWALPGAPGRVRQFFFHGSFGVLRSMAQHEQAFRRAVSAWARYLAGTLARGGDDGLLPHLEEFVRAKLCGRWPDGPVVQPDHLPCDRPPTPPDLQTLLQRHADFDFQHDPDGRGCPLGAHIRRMNPRGQDVALSARPRPLFRRGMPFGPSFEEGPEDAPRGLLGLFFCSDIEDQFEHLLGQWADRMPMGFAGAGSAKDPLIGAHQDRTATLVVPRPQASPLALPGPPWTLHNFEPFVTTRGSLYAFYPSCYALQRLVNLRWQTEEAPWPVR